MRPEDWDGEDAEELEDAEWCPCERCDETWELSDLRMSHDMMICPDCRAELEEDDDLNREEICINCGKAWHLDELDEDRFCPDCAEENPKEKE